MNFLKQSLVKFLMNTLYNPGNIQAEILDVLDSKSCGIVYKVLPSIPMMEYGNVNSRVATGRNAE